MVLFLSHSIDLFVGLLLKLLNILALDGRMGHGQRKNTLHFSMDLDKRADPGFFHFLYHYEIVFFSHILISQGIIDRF